MTIDNLGSGSWGVVSGELALQQNQNLGFME